jgi:1-acyl-sn-glycerol-3-phosphate acyltransferase
MSEPTVQAPGEHFRVWPPERTWRFARLVMQSWAAPMMRLKVYGQDRIPATGGVLIASNHIAGDDPIVLGFSSPRSIRFMAKSELWSIPVVGRLMPHTGAFPVRRGEADREAIALGRDVLRSGNLLGVFVEGTRQSSGAIGAAHTGAAMLAVMGGAPIIPACIHGTDHHRRNPFHRATIAYGTPIDVSRAGRGARAYKAIAAAIEEELRGLQEFIIAAEKAGRPDDAVPPVSRPFVEDPRDQEA